MLRIAVTSSCLILLNLTVPFAPSASDTSFLSVSLLRFLPVWCWLVKKSSMCELLECTLAVCQTTISSTPVWHSIVIYLPHSTYIVVLYFISSTSTLQYLQTYLIFAHVNTNLSFWTLVNMPKMLTPQFHRETSPLSPPTPWIHLYPCPLTGTVYQNYQLLRSSPLKLAPTI